MADHCVFWKEWQELVSLAHEGKTARESASVRNFAEPYYFDADNDHEARRDHQAAKRGMWVSPTMARPHVSDLMLVTAGVPRKLADGADLDEVEQRKRTA